MNKLRDFRESKNMSRAEMAQCLGISHSFYEKIELGDRDLGRKFLLRLKEKFPDVDMNIFFANK